MPIGEIDMKLTNVKDLQGGEYLAKPILLDGNTILIYEGTEIKKEYINQLIEIGIDNVYIRDENDIIGTKEEKSNNKFDLKDLLSENYSTLQEIYEQHTFDKRSELKAITEIADSIVDTIMENKISIATFINQYCNPRNQYDLYEHLLYVCISSLLIGKQCYLDRETMYDLAIGCLLHDIGLRYITCEYMNFDLGQMEAQQSFEFKKHTVYGYTAIEGEEWLSENAKMIILFHHEKINGKGYPLKQKKLSIPSKIISICDTLDGMISGIAFQKHKVHEALDYISNEKNSSFDSTMVELLLKIIPKYPTGSIVITNNDNFAMVTQQNISCIDRPKIRFLKNSSGDIIKDNSEIDLAIDRNIFIQEVLE